MEELKEGWRRVKLGELINSVSETFKTPNEKVILINTSDVLEGKVLNHELVENKNLKGQFKKKFENGDILYSEIRPQNKRFARIDFDASNYIASTKLMVLRNKNREINSDFLYLILKSNKFIEKLQTIAESRSGTFPQITFNDLANIEIELPLLETQEKIASILSALDDKIEINNEMNKTLEEMAQTLFKRWFIDFDFPNENGEPYRSSGGKMVDSELGEIPEGWEVTILGDLFKFVKGKKPKIVSESFSEETPLKYLTIKGFNGDENLYASEDKIILIDKKDIVMVMDGASSGDVYIGKSGVLGSTFSKIEKTKEINWSYIYLILKYYENDIKSHTTGSAIPHTDKGYVEKIRVSLPNLELLNFLSKELSGIIKRKLINQEEIQSLTEIRDILLPKLMNGEIEV